MREQARIPFEIPVCPDAVAVQHQQGLLPPWLRKFRRLPVLMSDDAVMGHEMAPFVSGHDDRSDVADAGEPDDLRPFVEHGNAEGRASGGLGGLMRGFQDFYRRKMQRRAADRVDDGRCGVRGDDSMTQPIGDGTDPATGEPPGDPIVAADRFSGFRLADGRRA